MKYYRTMSDAHYPEKLSTEKGGPVFSLKTWCEIVVFNEQHKLISFGGIIIPNKGTALIVELNSMFYNSKLILLGPRVIYSQKPASFTLFNPTPVPITIPINTHLIQLIPVTTKSCALTMLKVDPLKEEEEEEQDEDEVDETEEEEDDEE